MRLRPVLALTALIMTAFVLSACSADSPLADGPGPLPDRVGPLANNRGNEEFNAENYAAALDAYALADQKIPERPEPEYNSGNALYRLDNLEEAQAQYQGALARADDAEISRNSVFNIGNVLFESGEYADAVEAYKEALRLDPTDLDAKHNLELALRRLQQRQSNPDSEPQSGQPQNQNQQQNDQSAQQQNQDQQQQDTPSEQPQQSEPEQNPDDQTQPTPVEGLTEDQARQLLQSVGENTDTLQSKIQQVLVVSGRPPERNW